MKLFRAPLVILYEPISRIRIILISGIEVRLRPRRIPYVEFLLANSLTLKLVNIKLLFVLVIAIFIELK